MMTLRDFLELAMDDYYKINIFYNNTGVELLHQVEVGGIEEELENIDCSDLMDETITSWDICEERNNEFTLNIG